MLIYSFDKEFIGIDEKYLEIFGFSDLVALQKEHKDFSAFFVKKPGYIYNFQHVHWIDFIDCAESVEESKVMIEIHDKIFTADIGISTIYLSESPSSKSFIIELNNLRQLSGDTDPIQLEMQELHTDELEDIEDSYENVAPLQIIEPDYDLPLEIDIEMEDKLKEEDIEDVVSQSNYVFNPEIASNSLGLPVDLIKEFIEDFIAQAREFEPKIYKALAEGKIETVAMLSHKLKGVAGNLKVENAFDKLCIISESKDIPVLKSNLDDFYHIIAQLTGEEETPLEIDLDDDDFVLEFKDEEEIEEKKDIVSAFNKIVTASEIGLDVDSFNELLEEYVQSAFVLIEDMKESLDSGDIEKCRKQALRLKNMSDSMHITDLASDLLSLANNSDKYSMRLAIDNMNTIIKQISK